MLLKVEQRSVATNLLRRFIWADRMRQQYEEVHPRVVAPLKERQSNNEFGFVSDVLDEEMYLFLWLSLLATVIEGWPSLKTIDQELTSLLRSPYKNMLRDFRNATFHPKDHDDERIRTLVDEGQASIDWARQVTEAFRTFFKAFLETDDL